MTNILAGTALMGVVLFFFIDNAAHIGGALTGALIGVMTTPRRGQSFSPGWTRAWDRAGWIAVDVLAVGVYFAIWRLLR